MFVEWSTSESFADVRRVSGPAALEDTGFTAKVDLTGLPGGQRISYRVLFQDLEDLSRWSEPVAGRFSTPAASRRDVTLAWTADTVGQGWGINPEWGGLRLYETMRAAEPDVFVHCGDTVYADQPLVAEVALDDGGAWKNLVTPAKSKVAETLDEFRGHYLYNLLDAHVRRFNAEVGQVVLWDDHEVRNNWYPTQVLTDDRYRERSVALLAARAKRALWEHNPIRATLDEAERVYRSIPYGPSLDVFALDMRTYRAANSANRQPAAGPETALLGRAQLDWLKGALRASRATWKVVASDMPLGLVVPDGPADFEAVANGNGPALGRELEIAELLAFLKRERVRNVVWITGDVHYAAAHHYDPGRARFTDFDGFWEFVAGPAHAGTFGPNPLDDTFGPEVRFLGIPPDLKPNRPPSAGLQFFGTLAIDGRTDALTARLHDLGGRAIFSVELPPDRQSANISRRIWRNGISPYVSSVSWKAFIV
jgi:alkaline phosphatase D